MQHCMNAVAIIRRRFVLFVLILVRDITQKTERNTINLILRHFIEAFQWIKYYNQEFIGGHSEGRCFFGSNQFAVH